MLDIFRAWLVDASRRLAFAHRGAHWSYNLSTSFNGLSARKIQYVYGRVFVAVVMLATLNTIELPNIKRHLAVDMAEF